MDLQNWIELPLVQAAGWALVHSLWQGAIVAVVLAGILVVTRCPRRRYAAACLGLALMLVSFMVTWMHFAPLERTRSVTRASLAFDRLLAAEDGPLSRLRAGSELADLLPWIATFWMAGVLAFHGRQGVGWLGARRLQRTGVCAVASHWQERLDGLAARMRVSQPVVLLESCLAEVPVVIGHLRPVILIPVGVLTGLSASQVELILLHELAHIRRHDYLVNMLATTAHGILFYHPATWWISKILRTEREHCADDLAVAVAGDPYQYAAALTALEQNRIPETAVAATGGDLMIRIRRLLIPEAPHTAVAPFLPAGLLIVTGAVGLTAWQASTPAPAPAVRYTTRGQPVQTPQNSSSASPYTNWLNEDVVYIITRDEREAFLSLQTDPEREQFVSQFWARRNPTPGSSENPFRKEHYRRIAYANLHFPTATGEAGWRTDRGRIYITFGPPDEITSHPAREPQAHSAEETWHYQFIQGIGNDVYMQFVDANGTNEFRMTDDPANAR